MNQELPVDDLDLKQCFKSNVTLADLVEQTQPLSS